MFKTGDIVRLKEEIINKGKGSAIDRYGQIVSMKSQYETLRYEVLDDFIPGYKRVRVKIIDTLTDNLDKIVLIPSDNLELDDIISVVDINDML